MTGDEGDPTATELTREAAAGLRAACDRLVATAGRSKRARAIAQRLDAIVSAVERPIRIAIAGEFNTGKSALCNRLVDADTLPTAAIATTNIATRLHHSPDPSAHGVTRDGRRVSLMSEDTLPPTENLVRLDVGLPAPLLERAELIDLPGLADPRFQRRITRMGISSCDAVLWCTASMQAWKESERAAWTELPERLKSRTILVLTHADLVRLERDRVKVLDRIRGQYGAMFADIRLISAKPPPQQSGDAATTQPDNDPTGIGALRGSIDTLVSSLELRRATVATRLARELLQRARDA